MPSDPRGKLSKGSRICVEHIRSRHENDSHSPTVSQHGCTLTDQLAAQTDLGRQLGTTHEKVKGLQQQGGCCSYMCLSNPRKDTLLQEVKWDSVGWFSQTGAIITWARTPRMPVSALTRRPCWKKYFPCWLCSSKHKSTKQASEETWNLARGHFRQVTDSHKSHSPALVFPMGHNTMTSQNSWKNEFKQGSLGWSYCMIRLQEGL